MVTVAVTGAGGFVGGHVCRALVERGYRTIGMTRTGSTRQLPADLLERVEMRQGDVLDMTSLDAALKEADVVVHCAALVTVDDNACANTMAVNATGTGNVLQTCLNLGISRVVHVSSVHAYARMRGKVLNGDASLALDATLAYPSSKAAGHQAVLQAIAQGRIGGCVICPGPIIGPGDDRPSVAGGLVLDFALRKVPMTINEGFWWSDVRDVADAVASAVSCGKDGKVYFTLGRYAKLAQLARIISRYTGCGPPRLSVPYWVAVAGLPAVRAYAAARRLSPLYTRAALSLARNCPASADDGSARNQLGYTARPLEESIKDTVAWFRQNGDLA
ncbi:MAG: SDR family NAD(P)-dependent oxidoreductase [Chloroflexi bacterium]|nr:SDR family NAD(P)-dependent oxidoreductase [Chloroflexota bacterium]